MKPRHREDHLDTWLAATILFLIMGAVIGTLAAASVSAILKLAN